MPPDPPPPDVHEITEKYLDLLDAGNARMNLTRIVGRDAARILHVADARTLLPFLEKIGPGGRVLDVGSGGGVPGMILAIGRPDLFFVLTESTGKKARFLAETAAELGLKNVEVYGGRAEGWRGEKFDAVTARAVASLEVLWSWSRPLLNPGGCLLAMKGPKVYEEAEKVSRGRIEIVEINVPGLAGHVVAKVGVKS